MEDVRRLVNEGHKIEAIKIYRSIHGVGLREAKDAIDGMRP
jgi:ribosomal protein L7/L12